MNRIIFATAMLLVLSVFSCQDTKENLRDPLSEKDVYKTVGEAIPYETGMEWIEFYKRQQHDQGRLDLLTPYNISATQVDALLNSVPDLVGVAFHYGIDEFGRTHIVAIPVDGSLSLWSADGRVLIDANTNSRVSLDIAKSWAENYQKLHADAIWFHFFGKNVFDSMRAIPYFDDVNIEPAINVLNLQPQLLLVINNDDLVSFGRTADETGIVYDASNPCPPCAVH